MVVDRESEWEDFSLSEEVWDELARVSPANREVWLDFFRELQLVRAAFRDDPRQLAAALDVLAYCMILYLPEQSDRQAREVFLDLMTEVSVYAECAHAVARRDFAVAAELDAIGRKYGSRTVRYRIRMLEM